MEQDRGGSDDESTWCSSPVAVLSAAQLAGPGGKAEAARIAAVPSNTGSWSTHDMRRDNTVNAFACQENSAPREGNTTTEYRACRREELVLVSCAPKSIFISMVQEVSQVQDEPQELASPHDSDTQSGDSASPCTPNTLCPQPEFFPQKTHLTSAARQRR